MVTGGDHSRSRVRAVGRGPLMPPPPRQHEFSLHMAKRFQLWSFQDWSWLLPHPRRLVFLDLYGDAQRFASFAVCPTNLSASSASAGPAPGDADSPDVSVRGVALRRLDNSSAYSLEIDWMLNASSESPFQPHVTTSP